MKHFDTNLWLVKRYIWNEYFRNLNWESHSKRRDISKAESSEASMISQQKETYSSSHNSLISEFQAIRYESVSTRVCCYAQRSNLRIVVVINDFFKLNDYFWVKSRTHLESMCYSAAMMIKFLVLYYCTQRRR